LEQLISQKIRTLSSGLFFLSARSSTNYHSFSPNLLADWQFIGTMQSIELKFKDLSPIETLEKAFLRRKAPEQKTIKLNVISLH